MGQEHEDEPEEGVEDRQDPPADPQVEFLSACRDGGWLVSRVGADLRIRHRATATATEPVAGLAAPSSRAGLLTQHEEHDDQKDGVGDDPQPERHQAVPSQRSALHYRSTDGRRHHQGDAEAEVGDPTGEDRPGLVIEQHGQPEAEILGDDHAHRRGEGDPGQVVEQHDQLWIAVGSEGRDQPEEIGDGEEGGAGGCRTQIAVRQHLGRRGHSLHLVNDDHEERQQHDRAEVEDDHAGSDHRGVPGVEPCHFCCAHSG